jgi:hypothetical protein
LKFTKNYYVRVSVVASPIIMIVMLTCIQESLTRLIGKF